MPFWAGPGKLSDDESNDLDKSRHAPVPAAWRPEKGAWRHSCILSQLVYMSELLYVAAPNTPWPNPSNVFRRRLDTCTIVLPRHRTSTSPRALYIYVGTADQSIRRHRYSFNLIMPR